MQLPRAVGKRHRSAHRQRCTAHKTCAGGSDTKARGACEGGGSDNDMADTRVDTEASGTESVEVHLVKETTSLP